MVGFFIQVDEPEVQEFSWSVMVPPYSKMKERLDLFDRRKICKDHKFHTGFLARVDHKWRLSFDSNSVTVLVVLPRIDPEYRYSMRESQLQLLSNEEIKSIQTLCFTNDQSPSNRRGTAIRWFARWCNITFYNNKGEYHQAWNDSINQIRILLRVERTSNLRNTHAVMDSLEDGLRYQSILENGRRIDCSPFFMSDQFSDVVLECEGQTFPAHRFLLACRSPVFHRMFSVDMKEAAEGRIVIEDMEPQAVIEMLRFMYCGNVSMLRKDLWIQLLTASDKYDMPTLKILCENEIVKLLNPTNAIELYVTADLHQALLVKDKALKIIRLSVLLR
ncbi:unnamed protein product [Orchesella dallaii]|uniref:BTB domain-containing protein n=1 Tax=Orchesella dallaii TaxID=48710 RepID=A0ABP1RXM8_9HEXA